MNRFLLIALLLLAGSTLEAQLSSPELEDGSEFARRAAKAAIAGPQRIFAEALDTNSLLESRLGADTWARLTERQREQLRSQIRDYFLQALAPPRSTAAGEIAWAATVASPGGNGADFLLGLKYGERTLKTRWAVRKAGGGWRVSDVVLSDPGISLAQASISSLGPEPVRRRERRREAERAAYPRLAAIAGIALLLALVAPRVSAPKRKLLFLTASTPALLFLVDGGLAVRRTLSEPYALAAPLVRAPWRAAERLALDATREGRTAQAVSDWERARSLGGPTTQIDYQMGLAARQLGDDTAARADFERALQGSPAVPGANKELAVLDLSQGDSAQAEKRLQVYLALTGPDPEALSLLAVVQTNLGESSSALDAITRARSLVGESWRESELEARVRAGSGDAAGAVAALRPLADQAVLDRSVLRADPAYVRIATDPAWVAFLNEKPKKQ